MIMDLSAENAVYKKNQKKLFRSHDEVMDANKSLQSGIAESQKVLELLTEQMTKLTPKLDRALKRRRAAIIRFRRYKTQLAKRKESSKYGHVSDEIERYETLIIDMKKRVTEMRAKVDGEQRTVDQIKKLTGLRDELAELNDRHRNNASEYWSSLDLDSLNIDDSIRKMFSDLQRQMELGDALRKELEGVSSYVREPNKSFYKSIEHRLNKCNSIIGRLEKTLDMRPATPVSPRASGTSDLLSSSAWDLSSTGASQTSEAEIFTISARVSLLRKKIEKTERKLVVPVVGGKSGSTTPKASTLPRTGLGLLSPPVRDLRRSKKESDVSADEKQKQSDVEEKEERKGSVGKKSKRSDLEGEEGLKSGSPKRSGNRKMEMIGKKKEGESENESPKKRSHRESEKRSQSERSRKKQDREEIENESEERPISKKRSRSDIDNKNENETETRPKSSSKRRRRKSDTEEGKSKQRNDKSESEETGIEDKRRSPRKGRRSKSERSQKKEGRDSEPSTPKRRSHHKKTRSTSEPHLTDSEGSKNDTERKKKHKRSHKDTESDTDIVESRSPNDTPKRKRSRRHREDADKDATETSPHRKGHSSKQKRAHSSHGRRKSPAFKLSNAMKLRQVSLSSNDVNSGAKDHETQLDNLCKEFDIDRSKVVVRSHSCPCISQSHNQDRLNKRKSHTRHRSTKKKQSNTDEIDSDGDDTNEEVRFGKHVTFAESRTHGGDDNHNHKRKRKRRHEDSDIQIESDGDVITFTSSMEGSQITLDSSDDEVTEERQEMDGLMGRIRALRENEEKPAAGPRIIPANTLCKHRILRSKSRKQRGAIRLSEQRRRSSQLEGVTRSSQDIPEFSESLPDGLESAKFLSRSEVSFTASPTFSKRVYPTEATGNIFISRDALDSDFGDVDKNREKVSQTKWAYSLLQNVIQNQLSRTRMQVGVASAKFQLSQLNDEITTLEDDLLLTGYELQGRHPQRSLAMKVLSIYIPPAASHLTPYRRKTFSTQTKVTNADLAKVNATIDENNDFLSKNAEAEHDKMIADTHLPVLEQALQEYRRNNDKLFFQVEKMERRLELVQPGTKRIRKETRHRMRYEAAMKEDLQKSFELDERIKSQYQEIDDLKKRIEDQRQLHNTLRAKIDEQRKAPLPNVVKLHKQRDSLRSFTKTNEEQYQMLSILEESYDQQIDEMKKAVKGVPDLNMTVKAIRSRVDSMKVIANRSGNTLTSQAEMKELETRTNDVSYDYEQLQLKEKRLITRIKVLVTKLLNYKLSVPPGRSLDIVQGFM